MNTLTNLAGRHPVLAYLVLCFVLTWSVWFAVPLFAAPHWPLMKVLIGLGFGPALAAIILDRLRGTGARLGGRRWWLTFTPVFLIVLAISVAGFLIGDAPTTAEFAVARGLGLTPGRLAGSLAAALMAGFIFATVAGSRARTLNSLLAWRGNVRWLLFALLFPAVLYLTGLAITYFAGGELPESARSGMEMTRWLLYVERSILFTLLVVAVGEEAGWRGWLLPELQKRFSPLVSSIFIGLAWGLWHFPLYVIGLYPDEPQMVFAKMGACVFLSIIFTWLYNRSGGILLTAVLLHTAFNNTSRLVPPSEGMGVVLFASIAAAILVDRMWRRRAAVSATS